jgi:hypothetical protein
VIGNGLEGDEKLQLAYAPEAEGEKDSSGGSLITDNLLSIFTPNSLTTLHAMSS